MADSSLTPQEYELVLRDLRDRLKAHLERGEGDRDQLLRESQDALETAPQFPQVYEKFPDMEGMVADLLARRQQAKFMAGGREREAPGCLLGWLFSRKRS